MKHNYIFTTTSLKGKINVANSAYIFFMFNIMWKYFSRLDNKLIASSNVNLINVNNNIDVMGTVELTFNDQNLFDKIMLVSIIYNYFKCF